MSDKGGFIIRRWTWAWWGIGILVCCVLIPTIVVQWGSDEQMDKESKKNGKIIRVYLTEEQKVIDVPLESYVAGVVAAEMPVKFHPEALKAQALTARTYIMRRMQKGDYSDMKQYGPKAQGAMVSDTVKHQVFSSDEKLKKSWENDYQANKEKIQQAVNATDGKVVTYQNKPIYAAFFSTSNGFTENSEDYFQSKYAYLRSVPSSWDRKAPRFKREKKMSVKEMTQALEKHTGKQVAIPVSDGYASCAHVKKRTTGKRVAVVKVGDQTFSGREVREALQLPSSDFACQRTDDQVLFTTEGYGHGVGMSQWGANLMAQKGYDVSQIINHYYSGVKVEEI